MCMFLKESIDNMIKKIILIGLFIVLFFTDIIFALAEDTYDVILFWGQSNMVGYAGSKISSNGTQQDEDDYDSRIDEAGGASKFSQITEIDLSIINNYTAVNHVNVPIQNGTVYEYLYLSNSMKKISASTDKIGEKLTYNNGVLQDYSSTLGYYSIQQSYGTNIVPQFAETYYDMTGHKVIAILAANGGEQIAHFLPNAEANEESLSSSSADKNQYIYEAMVTKYNAAINYLQNKNYKIGNRIYVVFQGETNAIYANRGQMSAHDYYNTFMKVHNHLKEDCGITLGAIVETARASGTGYSDGVKLINIAQKQLIKDNNDIILGSDYPYRKYIPSADQYYKTDYSTALTNAKYSACDTAVSANIIHFTSAALSQIGKESATNVANFVNNAANEKLKLRDYKLSDNVIVVPNGVTALNLKDKIDNIYPYNVINTNNSSIDDNTLLKTGNKLQTTFMGNIYDYDIAVLGDVLGNGGIDNNGIIKTAKHILDGNVITDNKYKKSADFNSDGSIKINDVMMMLNSLRTENEDNNDYIVTYDSNGGINLPNKQLFKYNSSEKISSTIPTKTGYTFTGWKISGTNTILSAGDSIPSNMKSFTLIAQWRINKVRIKHDMNGGAMSDLHANGYSSIGSIVSYNDAEYIKTINFNGKTSWNGLADYNNKNGINIEKTGYIAKEGLEWNTKADGTGKSYSQDMIYLASDFCDLSKNDCEITLYVNWIPKTVLVEFNRNISTSDTVSARQTFTYGGIAGVNSENSSCSARHGNQFGYKPDGTPQFAQTGQFGRWDYDNHQLLGWNATAEDSSASWSTYSCVTDNWINNHYPYIKLYAIWQANSE